MNPLAYESWSSVNVGEQMFLFSPMIALIATMLAIVAAPLLVGRGARTMAGISIVGTIVAFILAYRVTGSVSKGGVSGFASASAYGLLIADNLSTGFQLVLLAFLAGVTYLWWIGSAEREENAPEFFILLIGSALGMALMVSTTHLLMIVIAIETASLPSYAIVGFDKRDRLGAEASLKYMIFGAVSAAIMLYGASLLYGLVGSLNVADIARYTFERFTTGENLLLLAVGLLCFLAGIAFKISAVPFHFWCPDAFQGARVEVTTWLSVASKAAGLILLARIVSIFCSTADGPQSMHIIAPLAWTIGVIASVSCTVGNFAAYQQQSVKRLLAYSSIAHAGYMMMAAAVFLHPQSGGFEAGLSALFFYIVIYLFMNLGAFGVTAMVVWATGSDSMDAFAGLMRRSPALAVPMIVCLMSLVGLPPLAGFLGKWWILVALGSMGGGLGWLLIIVACANTLFSLYFYMRVVVQMTLRDRGAADVRGPIGGLALVNLCAIALLVLFLFAAPMKSQADRFTSNMFRPAATDAARADSSRSEDSTEAVAPQQSDRTAGLASSNGK